MHQRASTGTGSNLFVTGTFQNANGDARADNVAWFDGTAWHPLGSDGAGNGPWSRQRARPRARRPPALCGRELHERRRRPQAHSVASFSLSQVIAYPTPTVTPGPSAVPTPTVTPAPTPAAKRRRHGAEDARSARRRSTRRSARRRSGSRSGEPGSKFACKLDKQKFKPCTSPKTYKKLKPGKHVFRVKARDRAGNVDKTPTVKRFKIERRR